MLLVVTSSAANVEEAVSLESITEQPSSDAELKRVLASFQGLAKFFGRSDVIKKVWV